METLSLIQGTPEWHLHRATHKNASDSPAVMGESSYKTRNQLLKEMATGIKPEVDSFVQKKFDDGHRFEAFARPIAESIIGEDLYPVTGVNGSYSASFDGSTMDERIAFEHKTLNEKLRAVMEDGCQGVDLPVEYQIQMEHQLLVSGGEKVLFMASKWNGNQLVEQFNCWYFPSAIMRARLIAAWEQFDKDLAAYQHVESVEPAKAAQETTFPVVVMNVTGSLSASNLGAVTPKFDLFLTTVKTNLQTDEDFAHGEADAKLSRTTAKALKVKAKEVIDQISSVSDAVRTLEEYAVKFDAMGLKLEKAVKEQKDAIKASVISESKVKFSSHLTALNQRLGKAFMPTTMPDFVTAAKNKRTVASLREACDTLLANSKIEANEVADRIQANITSNFVTSHGFLFSDLSVICTKNTDDFLALATLRVNDYKVKEAAAAAEKAASEAKKAEEAEAAMSFPTLIVVDEAHQAKPLSDVAAAVGVDFGRARHSFMKSGVVMASSSPLTGSRSALTQRAATRSLIDNLLDTLTESQLSEALLLLQSQFLATA